ncbi:hypothetical protein BH10ACI2_BH10ACI2_13940 [soil metagenome]
MNKIGQTTLQRLFLVERLPEPLTPASSHLQIYDNYLEQTRIRLRQVRDPYSNTWTRILQQLIPAVAGEFSVYNIAEMYLNEAEFTAFERLPGLELRKNRYFHEFDQASFVFDVYLGRLRGLHMAKVDFEDREQMDGFVPPRLAIFEVTNDAFFSGASLAEKTFVEIQTEVARIGSITPIAAESADE